MKLSDFYLTSRHLFAYVAPGALCISGAYLMLGKEPIVELAARPWALHLIFYIAASFVLGFVLQTMVFKLLEHWAPNPGLHEYPDDQWVQDLAPIVKKALCADCGLDRIDDARVPKFCRNLALEYGGYMRYRIGDFENEINFMVALAFSLPVVSFGWLMYREWTGVSAWIPIVLAVIYIGFTLRRIPQMRRHETIMWCEKYLILRARAQLDPDRKDD